MKYLILILILSGCTQSQKQVDPKEDRISLSWENKHPERQAWSDSLVAALAQKTPDMSKAKDIKTFCPKYELLEPKEKIKTFAEIVVGMAKFESSWKPETSYRECLKARCQYSSCFNHPTYGYCMKGNPKYEGGVITSRGLLQLSIESSLGYGCKLDSAKDLDDPLKNIICAVTILDKQIKRTGVIAAQRSYWSVIKIGYSKNHIGEIAKMVQSALPACK